MAIIKRQRYIVFSDTELFVNVMMELEKRNIKFEKADALNLPTKSKSKIILAAIYMTEFEKLKKKHKTKLTTVAVDLHPSCKADLAFESGKLDVDTVIKKLKLK